MAAAAAVARASASHGADIAHRGRDARAADQSCVFAFAARESVLAWVAAPCPPRGKWSNLLPRVLLPKRVTFSGQPDRLNRCLPAPFFSFSGDRSYACKTTDETFLIA